MSANAGTMNTDLGSVIIDSDVIAKYAGASAVACFGIVGMAMISVKDGIARLLKLDSLKQGVASLFHPTTRSPSTFISSCLMVSAFQRSPAISSATLNTKSKNFPALRLRKSTCSSRA